TANTTDNAQRYLVRTDRHFSNSDNMFARYFQSDRDRFIPGNFGGIADGTSTSAWGRQNMKTRTFAAGWNHTVTSSSLNELRFGYNKADSTANHDPFGQTGINLGGVPLDPPAARRSATFRNTFTGQVLGDFLLGYVSDAQLSNLAETHQQLSSYSLYAQDDWKPNDKVTVNAGLRYDFMTPQLERDNHIANFDATGAGRLPTAASGSIEDRALVNPDRNNIA